MRLLLHRSQFAKRRLLALSNVAKARGVIQLAAAAGVEPGSH